MIYSCYLQVGKDIPRRCFHTFNNKTQAVKYAELGAKNCKGRTFILNDETAEEVIRFDYRPN